MKTCPSCGADVPLAANLCKHCFHDFNEAGPAGVNKLTLVLGALATMSMIGAATFTFVSNRPDGPRCTVKQDTESIVCLSKTRDGASSDTLLWADIQRLEYVSHPNSDYEIRAVLSSGGQKVIDEGAKPLRSRAYQYAKVMKKPLEEIDKTRGFHKNEDGNH